MTRRVVYAMKDTTHRGVAVKKGGVLGEDERPWPEPDGVTWWFRDVLDAPPPESHGGSGWVKVPGRVQPRRVTPKGPDEPIELPEMLAAPVQPKELAALGDSRHPYPAPPADDSDEEYQAHQDRLRVARAQVAADNKTEEEN
jgi:hypothetical protein